MSINQIFESFEKLKVLIIGDVMIDSYIIGKVERISPEAPIPIVNVRKRDKRLGGAGNVAMNIKSLGAEPILCAVVGKDSDGDDLIQLLKENQLIDNGIIQSTDRITTVKQRIMAGSQHIVRIDSEMDEVINQHETDLLLEKIEILSDNADVIIFEDYDKGVLTENLIKTTIEIAKKKGIPTIVDPKKRNFFNYIGADIFKPNLKELKEGLKIEINVNDIESIKEVVEEAKNRLGVKGIFLTLSEKGVYIDFEGEKLNIAAHVRSIADVSGAGDTVVSIAALCLALKLTPKDIASMANLGGGLVCEHIGVVPIDKIKLQNEYEKIKKALE